MHKMDNFLGVNILSLCLPIRPSTMVLIITAPTTPIIAEGLTPTTTPALPMAPAVDQLPGAPRVIEVGQSLGAVDR